MKRREEKNWSKIGREEGKRRTKNKGKTGGWKRGRVEEKTEKGEEGKEKGS